uniref:Uncharacterized protein MANES_14G008300 n=1 Tax=Rhizophora mucronata TaxID=61149 RepID=A0A2P2KDY5_RHIMU
MYKTYISHHKGKPHRSFISLFVDRIRNQDPLFYPFKSQLVPALLYHE